MALPTLQAAPRVLSRIPPMTQLNTPYPSTAYLTGFLRARGVDAVLTRTFDDAEKYLRENWREGDLVITHGCGDIDLLNEQIARNGDTAR